MEQSDNKNDSFDVQLMIEEMKKMEEKLKKMEEKNKKMEEKNKKMEEENEEMKEKNKKMEKENKKKLKKKEKEIEKLEEQNTSYFDGIVTSSIQVFECGNSSGKYFNEWFTEDLKLPKKYKRLKNILTKKEMWKKDGNIEEKKIQKSIELLFKRILEKVKEEIGCVFFCYIFFFLKIINLQLLIFF